MEAILVFLLYILNKISITANLVEYFMLTHNSMSVLVIICLSCAIRVFDIFFEIRTGHNKNVDIKFSVHDPFLG